MITREMIAADAALAGLTEEQIGAITLLSKNDEEVVIGNRFREVYNQLDATIAKETGIARNGDEKTYLYLERAAKILAAKANSVDGLNSKIADLTKERDKLQKALEEGGDDAVKKQLAQATKDLDAVRKQYDTLKGDYDKMKGDHAAELLNIQVDNVIANSMTGLKFKQEFPQESVDILVAQAKANVKAMSPEFVDDGKGGKKLVFKGANGEIARNPENHTEPYTAAELLQKELKAMGILDEGREQQGAGTKPPSPKGGKGTTIDLSMARTQVQATEIIADSLMRQGMRKGTKEYEDAMLEAFKENNVQSLPME